MDKKQTKYILIGVLVIALAGGAYYFGMSSKNSTQPAETIQNDMVSIATQERPAQKMQGNTELTPTSIDQASIDDGWQVIALGSEQITKDDNNFSVNITDLGKTIVPNDPLWQLATVKITQGKFVQVDIEINNIGLANENIELIPAQLFDQDGRVYEPVSTRNICNTNDKYNYFTAYAQTIKPNIPCIMKILCEVSQDSTEFTAKLFYKKN